MGTDEILLIKMPLSVLFVDSCVFSVWGKKKWDYRGFQCQQHTFYYESLERDR